jgi:glycosyltransferase involved in cell wall biosynthesis
MSITTLIHVKDNKLYIGEVIESWYNLSDDIIILNNNSTDGTLDIVRKFDKVTVVDDLRNWLDDGVGENTVRNDALKHCKGDFIAIPDSDEVLYEDQEDMIRYYLQDTNFGAWRFRKIEYFGDHFHIQDQYRGKELDGEGEEVAGFGRQVIHGHPYIYRNHPGLNYAVNDSMLYGRHSSIQGSQSPSHVRQCLDIKVAHYGSCMSNKALYEKTILYYNAVKDENDICRSKEYQDKIDPNNPLGFHPDQAVRPYNNPPKYMIDHPEAFHRITTTVDDIGKYRISSRSDTPLPVEIKVGTPDDCGRQGCNYNDPVFDVELKRKANEFTIIKALDYYTSTYELCCIHPNVFVMANENIPYNPQFNDIVSERIGVIHNNARHIVAASQSVRNALLVEGVNPKKISVINFWGCDTEHYKPINMTKGEMRALCSKYGVSINDRIVIYVGRIDTSKGISYLLDAISNIKDVKLLVAGSGDFTRFLIGREDELTSRVKYVGDVDRDQLLELYNLSDVLVLPSIPTPTWIEQFGRVLTEAMACSKPCISTCVGGPLDIIDDGKTGYLVPPCDSDALADKINLILDNPILANNLGKNGRDRCIELFSDATSSRQMRECMVNNIWR